MAGSYFSRHLARLSWSGFTGQGVKQPAALQELARIHCQEGETGGFLASPGACCAPAVSKKKKKKASEPFSGDRELRAEWLMQPQTLLLLLAHLLSKYLWVRWAQNVLKKMSGYLWIFCSYHLSKAARNCFQMAPERCLSFIKRKKATKLPRKELDVPDRMTQVSVRKHLDT